MCFFVLCNRHWLSRVPGANLWIACLPRLPSPFICSYRNNKYTGPTYPSRPTLALFGAPVTSERPGPRSFGRQDREPEGHPTGTGPHVAIRHNRGNDTKHSNRIPWDWLESGLTAPRRPQIYENKHRRVDTTRKRPATIRSATPCSTQVSKRVHTQTYK